MKRQENPGGNQIVTLLIVGVGGYMLYQYLVSSGMWAQWFGGGATGSSLPTLAQIQTGLQSGQLTPAGIDGAGNSIVHNATNNAFYAINPQTGVVSAASGPGTLASSNPGTTPPTSTPTTTAIPASIQSGLQSAAAQYMAANPGKQMTTDLWLYYYQILKYGANPNDLSTFPITGGQAGSVFAALGIDSTNPTARVTPVNLQQFVSAMSTAGVSGIISVPNNGPITAPLPTTQNFRGGYGGYNGGGKRGYLN